MPNYYGISFPFQDSTRGDFLRMTETATQEVRANLVHLLLTRKGTRYLLPDFGTRLYDYIFEQMDGQTFAAIEDEIRDAVRKYIPHLEIQQIVIREADVNEDTSQLNQNPDLDGRVYRVGDSGTLPHTAHIRVDYTINASVFATHDFVIINL